MKALKIVRLIILGFIFILTSLITAILNVVEFIRSFLFNLLELPDRSINIASIFAFFALLVVGFASERGSEISVKHVLFIILCIGACALFTFFLQGLIRFLYQIIWIGLGTALMFLSLQSVIGALTVFLKKVMKKYLGIRAAGTCKKDRFLYSVSYLFHVLNSAATTSGVLLSYAIYPISILLALYSCYKAITYGGDPSAVGGGWFEYFVNSAFILGLFSAIVYLGHLVSLALCGALDSVQGFDSLFSAYVGVERTRAAKCFHHKQPRRNRKGKEQSHQADFGSTATPEEPDLNPYIEILGAAKDADELHTLYRSYIKKLHPDVCKDYSPEESTRRAGQLNAAYDMLKEQYIRKV